MSESVTFTPEEAPVVYMFGAFWPVTHMSTSDDETNKYIFTAHEKTGVILTVDGVNYSAPYTPLIRF